MDESEAFGDPRFIGPGVLPTAEVHRTLATRPALALWASLVLHPYVFDFAVARAAFDPSQLLPALGGSIVVALLGVSLLRAPQRHGLGFVATARAAFGTRGAPLPVLVRWLAAVLWSAAWVAYLSSWLGRLALGVLRRFFDAEFLSLGWLSVLGSLLTVAAAYWASFQRIEGHAAFAPRRLGLAFLLGLTLVGLAAFQLEGAPLVQWGTATSASLGRQGIALALATLPALVAFTEWARYRARGGVDLSSGRRKDRVQRLLAPWILVPSALCFAAIGALLHEAGARASGLAPRGLVGSASAFGGVLGGVGAFLFVLVLFFALVPFAGFLAPTRGLRMSEKASRRLTAVSVLVVAGWVDPASALTLAGALVLPIVVILAVDELIVRRGRLELEGLYRAPSPYGALFGIGVAAPIATVLGWLSLLGRWDGLSFKGILAPADQLSALAAGEGIEVVILSSVVVALVYAVFRTVERALPQWPSPRRPAPGPERLESAPSSIQVPAFESEPRPADALPTGPLDPTVVEAAAAAFNESALKGDDKWPDERDDGSEANWFDGASDVSNPSITELGDPHFVKKRDDEA